MTRVAAALLLLVSVQIPAGARTDAVGGGRSIQASTDPTFDPVLRDIEGRMPSYEEIETTNLRVPMRTIELGPSAKLYRCWKLRLTGDHGQQALSVLERLSSIQGGLKELREKLAKDLVSYAGSGKPDAELKKRIRTRHGELDQLMATYRKLLRLGEKHGLLKVSEREPFSGHRSVSPKLKDDDYTMVFDETNPECRRGTGG